MSNNGDKKQVLGEVSQTGRGFEYISFEDRNGVACSLQASSLAEYEEPGTSAVWIGCEDADPKYFIPNGNPSWRSVEMPKDYIANTRAHLGREQVEALIRHPQNWLDKGTFEV